MWSPTGALIVFAGPIVAAESALLAVSPDGAPLRCLRSDCEGKGTLSSSLPDGKALVFMRGMAVSGCTAARSGLETRRPLTRLMNKGRHAHVRRDADGKEIVFDRLREKTAISC